MKFFSAALSAATIGSALASPILGSACGGHAAAPSGINGLPSGAAAPSGAGFNGLNGLPSGAAAPSGAGFNGLNGLPSGAAAPSGINGLPSGAAAPSGIPSGAASPIEGDDLVPASPIQTLTSATTLYQTWATTVSDYKTEYYTSNVAVPTGVPTVPSTGSGVDAGKIGSGATSGKAPVVIVKEVTTIVLNIDVLVKADITRITELVDCETGIDAQLLLEALVSLSGHLHTVVTGVIPQITTLIRPSVGLVAAELQIVLDLVADIEILLVQVEGCLKHLVATATHDVLKVISAELNLIAGLVLPIATPIVNFALRAVVGLNIQAPQLVAQIQGHAQSINKCAGGLHVFLGAALKIVL